MTRFPFRPLRLALLALLAATGPLAAPAPAGGPDVLRPKGWLLLPPADPGGRTPFRPSTVFRTQVAAEDAARPHAGDVVHGSDGREVAWSAAQADENGAVAPNGALWAFASLDAPRAGVWLLEANRVSLVLVNGRPVTGDVYGEGTTRAPVRLDAGPNVLFAAAFRGPFSISFEAPPQPVFLAERDATLPDLVRGETCRPDAGVVLVNATDAATGPLSVEVRAEADGAGVLARATVSAIAPLARRRIPLLLPELDVPADAKEGRLVVRVSEGDRRLDERSWPLAVRDAAEPRRVTFVSQIDGSVQEYALRPPVGDDEAGSAARPRGIVLSLHGAGVDCLNQARAYSPKPDLYIVAPTNRRPFGFDWQDWGRRDAYEVLADALLRTGVSRRRVWLTGHSMGGHGTWHLAVNDPDGFGAIAPSAAWVSFETYGGRGAASGPLDALWRASDAAAHTLDLLLNLRDLPIRQLHGGADDNVPVSEARRMAKALDGVAKDYQLTVVPGKGHWWDGDAAPGADCVDWPAFFETFRAHPIPEDPPTLQFTTVDPAVDSRHFWVRVLQPLRVGTPLRVKAARDGTTLRVETENTRRLVLDPPREDGVTSVVLDGRTLPVEEGASPWGFVRDGGTWRKGRTEVPTSERSPGRSGPFKRVFDRHFVLVVGTKGNPAEDARSLGRARQDADRWLYRANGRAVLVPDIELAAHPDRFRGRNVVLYGNADTNAAWDVVFPDRCPIRIERGKAKVGDRVYEGDDLAATFLYPRRDEPEALAGAVAWTGEPGERATVLSGYLASGVGYPDYVVFDETVLAKGDYGVKTAGFFDVTWSLAR